MPQTTPEGDFHVVRKRKFRSVGTKNIRYHTHFEVYCNNVPFLKGSGQALSKREAQWIADILNKRFKRMCNHRDPVAEKKKAAA